MACSYQDATEIQPVLPEQSPDRKALALIDRAARHVISIDGGALWQPNLTPKESGAARVTRRYRPPAAQFKPRARKSKQRARSAPSQKAASKSQEMAKEEFSPPHRHGRPGPARGERRATEEAPRRGGDSMRPRPPRKKSAKESAQAAARRRASQDFAPFADLVSLEPRETRMKRHLEQAQTALGHTRQEDARPRGLAKLARQLATPEISEHRSTSVRLWAATCVCEVLRIFAPNAPYGDGELLAAFRLLGAALKAAGAASNGRDGDLARRQARHVIESLRQFQSACALTELYASARKEVKMAC